MTDSHSELTSQGREVRRGEAIRFPALDGHEIGGIHYQSRAPATSPVAAVFAGGGGIRATVYRRFAAYLADAGIPVLCFDYRGIGSSRPKRLRGFAATAEDWSEWDCGGAIEWLHTRYPRAELVGIAHSIGTFLIGGAPNVGELKRLLFIGAHTGYYGDYRPGRRLPMALMWHV